LSPVSGLAFVPLNDLITVTSDNNYYVENNVSKYWVAPNSSLQIKIQLYDGSNDGSNNPVGVSVTLSLVGAPSGCSLDSNPVTTDANGTAYSNLSAGSSLGEFTIRASATNWPNGEGIFAVRLAPTPTPVPPLVPNCVEVYINLTPTTFSGTTYYSVPPNQAIQVNAIIGQNATSTPVPNTASTFQLAYPENTDSLLGAPRDLITDEHGKIFTTLQTGGVNGKFFGVGAFANTNPTPSYGNRVANLLIVEGAPTPKPMQTERPNPAANLSSKGGVYPNPFDPKSGESVRIEYVINASDLAEVTLTITTLRGAKVWQKTYPKNTYGAESGNNAVLWDGKNSEGVMVANGVYLCMIKSGSQTISTFKIGIFKNP
jgi:hypothetical protein